MSELMNDHDGLDAAQTTGTARIRRPWRAPVIIESEARTETLKSSDTDPEGHLGTAIHSTNIS